MDTQTIDRHGNARKRLSRREALRLAGTAGGAAAVGALVCLEPLLNGRVMAQEGEPGMFDDSIIDERGLLENGDFLMQLADAGSVDYATGVVDVDHAKMDEVLAAFVPDRAVDTVREGLLRHARLGFAVAGGPEAVANGRGVFVPWWLVGYLAEEGRFTLPSYVQRAILEDLGLLRVGSREPVVGSPEEVAAVVRDRFPNVPAGWFEVTVEGAVEPTPADGTAGVALPDAYLGEWEGSGVQDNPPDEWPITMSFNGGGVGEVVGTVTYPTLGCRGELILNAVEDAAVELTERIVEGPCVDGGAFRLEVVEDGTLGFSWIAPDGSSSAFGSLTQIGMFKRALVPYAIRCRSEDVDCEDPRLPDGLPDPEGQPTPGPGQKTEPGPVARSLWDLVQALLERIVKEARENEILRCLMSARFKNWWVAQAVCFDAACTKTIIDALTLGTLSKLGAGQIAQALSQLGLSAVAAAAIGAVLAAAVAAAGIFAAALQAALSVTPNRGACIVWSTVLWLFGFVGVGVMPNF